MFVNVALQAAVHLGHQDYDQNLLFVKNHFWKSVTQLFKETVKIDQELDRDQWCDTIDYKEHTSSATKSIV